MPRGVTSATNKTEFMRYLDAYPTAIPALRKRAKEYDLVPSRNCFGQWVRSKHADDFNAAYEEFWLTHPKLYGTIYQETTL